MAHESILIRMKFRQQSLGFTLLEMLIALAILAISLAAIHRVVTGAIGNAHELRLRLLATWVAENRLAKLRAEQAFPEPGEQAGQESQAGQNFHWRVLTSHTQNLHFRRVEVRVSLDEHAPHALAVLTGYLARK